MSLQVWLPLTKDLRNQGLSNVTVTNNGATFDLAGKLGGCYSFDGSDDGIRIDGDIIPQLQQNNFSICFWLFSNDAGDRSIYIATTPASDWGLSIEKTTANKLRVYWQNNPDFNSSLDIPDQQWCHIAVVIKDGNCYCYKNGEKLAERTSGDMTPAKLSRTWIYAQLGRDTRTGSTVLKGKMNDFRWYDHALNQMEVKELAKGLVLHYPLCNQHETGQVNKYSSPYSDGECSSSSFTKTKLINERGYNYKLTRTGDGTNSWPNWNVPNYSFTAGKTYYYSVKIRCNKWTSGDLVLRASRSNNDWVTRGVTICSPSLADGKWHEYYIYQTVNADYDRSGTTVTSNPVLEFYCSNQNGNGTVYDMDFDVKDVQVIESDCYVPFIENSFVGTTIYDCSGLRNNGTRTGMFNLTSDTPKYSFSTTFPTSGNNYINIGTQLYNMKDEMTVSIWAKANDWTSTSKGVPFSSVEGGGFGWQASSANYVFYCGSGTSSNTYLSSTVAVSGLSTGWHMLSATYDGLALKIYIDGELKNTVTKYTTKTPIYYNNNSGMFVSGESGGSLTAPNGSIFRGSLSDLKIYATALSADDVKSLYQNSAYIDSSGNVYGAVHEEV